MWIIRIRRILFELCLIENKKKKKKVRKKKNKFEFSTFDFLDCEEKSWDSGDIFDIRIAKCFLL